MLVLRGLRDPAGLLEEVEQARRNGEADHILLDGALLQLLQVNRQDLFVSLRREIRTLPCVKRLALLAPT